MRASVTAPVVAGFSSVQRDSIYRRSLVLADALAALTALAISTAVSGHGGLGAGTLAAVPLIVVMSKLLGTYERQEVLIRKSTLDEASVLFQLATLYAFTVWLIGGVSVTEVGNRRQPLVLWLALFTLLLTFRAAARWLCRLLTPPERCLVIGDASTCNLMELKLARQRALHATVIACIPWGELQDSADDTAAITAEDLDAVASALRADRIIVMPGTADVDEVLTVLRSARSLHVKVSILPRILEVVGSRAEFDDVEGVPLLSIRRVGFSRSSQLLKRGLDITGAVIGLAVLAPLMAVVALAIKIDSSGPVLFMQRRIGRDGKPFQILKFRTMVRHAEAKKIHLRDLNEADGLFKIIDDPRTTRVGRLLRRTCLDELPQLLNVIRGEMSLVGPRPLIGDEDRRIEGWRRRRLQLTPGMTGHWQILGSSRIPLNELALIDYLYVINWSLWLDIKILLATVLYLLKRRGM